MNLESFIILGAAVFAIGLYGALSKRNVITVLMCIELMFNGVIITAVAVSRYVVPAALIINSGHTGKELAHEIPSLLTGQIFTIFIITAAAAEIALGIAIVISLYRKKQTVFATDANEMKY